MPESPAAALPRSESTPRRSAVRGPLGVLAVLCGVLWLSFLSWLTFTTANPVTLNRAQLLKADCVVVAKCQDLDRGIWEVQALLKGGPIDPVITVSNLKAGGAQTGRNYVLPLHQVGKRWEAMPTPLPDHSPLIYPATDEVLEDVRNLLR